MNDNPTLAELNEMLAEELARHDLDIVSCAIISGLMDDVTARAEAAEARVAELEAAQQAAYNLGFADAAERFAGERVEPLIVSLEPQ